ncbi:hypothetical protein Thiowin_05049 [Thiorhodovibrio winogradskyi]|uniref:Uncharacterized protein n=1 Tax=Thiorhodovibrio winogradskyi TaxID=77007 RepID=A0ABZ0SKX5_9GAMM|nr:hypothetical protein [Thiorhodovibrio winogradskyi]
MHTIEIQDKLVAELAHRAKTPAARTALVEKDLRDFFAARDLEPQDRERLDHHATELNHEAEDVLGYQVISGVAVSTNP